MTAFSPRKNAEERGEKRSCPVVSYGRVMAVEREEKVDVLGSDGDGPRFVESRIHLPWSKGGVLVMKSVLIIEL